MERPTCVTLLINKLTEIRRWLPRHSRSLASVTVLINKLTEIRLLRQAIRPRAALPPLVPIMGAVAIRRVTAELIKGLNLALAPVIKVALTRIPILVTTMAGIK